MKGGRGEQGVVRGGWKSFTEYLQGRERERENVDM